MVATDIVVISQEQVYATLINLSLDDQACKKLLSLGVVERVIEILREDKAKDLNLAVGQNLQSCQVRI